MIFLTKSSFYIFLQYSLHLQQKVLQKHGKEITFNKPEASSWDELVRNNDISEGFPKFLEKIFLFTRTAITGFLKIMAYKTIVKAISVNSDALHELVPLVQFKKREKHPWRSVTFSKVTLLHGCFSRFLNCTNCTKSRKTSMFIRSSNTVPTNLTITQKLVKWFA